MTKQAPAKRIVVLISGNGRNLQALIDACAQQQINGKIVGVFSNRANAYGLERAKAAGIPSQLIAHQDYDSRESFDAALRTQIDLLKPDLVVLAGFMRILSDAFVNHYLGRLLNIHPSLLPKYPGLHTHQRALDAGDVEHGATVHFVTPELDAGPPVLQSKLQIGEGDTAADLAQRVMSEIELQLYPAAVSLYCNEQVRLSAEPPYHCIKLEESRT